jgi:hypothetical protein
VWICARVNATVVSLQALSFKSNQFCHMFDEPFRGNDPPSSALLTRQQIHKLTSPSNFIHFLSSNTITHLEQEKGQYSWCGSAHQSQQTPPQTSTRSVQTKQSWPDATLILSSQGVLACDIHQQAQAKKNHIFLHTTTAWLV